MGGWKDGGRGGKQKELVYWVVVPIPPLYADDTIVGENGGRREERRNAGREEGAEKGGREGKRKGGRES